ncbi:MAG: cytochrome c oxidase subunit II [Rivularia sp. (in: Bacteria)]|nr:cytochrome c oxidase subunit II [Rivularia sp. MS3]
MLRIIEYLVFAIGAAAIIVVSYLMGQWSYSWLPVEASTDAQRIDDLFCFLVTLGSVIFFGVIGMILFSLIAYRAPKGDYSEGHPIRGDWKLEVTWTAIPTLLVLIIVGYSFIIYQKMDIAGPTRVLGELPVGIQRANAQTINQNIADTELIEVISQQWDWTFRYPKQNVVSKELHLPSNQRVRLVLQSKDVLHGFYVPEFRIKQDIIPNRNINFQFIPTRVGKYQLHDSQFSGTYFAVMQADVYVDTPQDYVRWLAQAANHPSNTLSLAASEEAQPPHQVFKSNWYTVLPAKPKEVDSSNFALRNFTNDQ